VSEIPTNSAAEGPPPTPESNQATGDDLNNKLIKLEEQLKAEQQKYIYLYADFDNYKKRTVKERSELIKYGFENAARDLLQVSDNLKRAVDHMPESVDKNLRTGIQMVLEQFHSTLHQHGVEPILADGHPFDPNIHEAVGQQPSDKPAGTIIQEHQKGYVLHGRLLRPARVMISAGHGSKDGAPSA